MTSHGIFNRVKAIAVAITLTFVVNFAISEIVSSTSVAAEVGGVEMPKPPRPAPESLTVGGVEMPKPPRP